MNHGVVLLIRVDLIRAINDPEHPLTLEELSVVREGAENLCFCGAQVQITEHIDVDDDSDYVRVQFTPTIPHCSMATLIGLSIRVKLLRSLPSRFKVHISACCLLSMLFRSMSRFIQTRMRREMPVRTFVINSANHLSCQ